MKSALSFCAIATLLYASTAADTLDFAPLMQPVPPSARFEDPGYYVWCGAMVRGSDHKYHSSIRAGRKNSASAPG